MTLLDASANYQSSSVLLRSWIHQTKKPRGGHLLMTFTFVAVLFESDFGVSEKQSCFSNSLHGHDTGPGIPCQRIYAFQTQTALLERWSDGEG
jgi:hypothetical protein